MVVPFPRGGNALTSGVSSSSSARPSVVKVEKKKKTRQKNASEKRRRRPSRAATKGASRVGGASLSLPLFCTKSAREKCRHFTSHRDSFIMCVLSPPYRYQNAHSTRQHRDGKSVSLARASLGPRRVVRRRRGGIGATHRPARHQSRRRERL